MSANTLRIPLACNRARTIAVTTFTFRAPADGDWLTISPSVEPVVGVYRTSNCTPLGIFARAALTESPRNAGTTDPDPVELEFPSDGVEEDGGVEEDAEVGGATELAGEALDVVTADATVLGGLSA